MKKFVIKEILDLKISIPEIKIIKQNIPISIRVTESEYFSFIEENKKYIGESYNNAPMDTFIVKDFYGNIIARVCYYVDVEYYINPDLLALGIKEKTKIENKTEMAGTKVVKIDTAKPWGFDI